MKFNVGVTGVVALVLWAAVSLADRRFRALGAWSLAAVGVFVATFVGGFRAYGGPIEAVPDFIANSFRIAAAYSAQMSDAGPARDLYEAAVCVGVLAVFLVWASFRRRRYAAVGLLLCWALFALVKSAFVRHDTSHAFLFFATVPAYFALLLVLPERPIERWTATAACLIVLAVAIHGRVAQSSPQGFSLADCWPDGPGNLRAALHWADARRDARDAARRVTDALRMPASLLHQVSGRPADAYPWEMTLLFANGLPWCPRPIPQSYSAYTPELDELNARHYRAPAGPELVLYHSGAIDGEHPWFVDPLTLRELASRYDVAARSPLYLLLARRSEPRPVEPVPVTTSTVRLGSRVPVPSDSEFLLAAALEFRLTPAGRARDLLWKVYPPRIQLELADGSTREYRIVWRNAVNGLLISELPATLEDVDALWRPEKRTAVTGFTLFADPADFDTTVGLTWLRSTVAKRAKAP
jgi:hypothetical protein